MEERVTRTTIYLKEKTVKQLDRLCKIFDENKSWVIRKAIKLLNESTKTNKEQSL
jgi:predicted transcriptional regulator